jgi:hypothetical protein
LDGVNRPTKPARLGFRPAAAERSQAAIGGDSAHNCKHENVARRFRIGSETMRLAKPPLRCPHVGAAVSVSTCLRWRHCREIVARAAGLALSIMLNDPF